MPRQRSRRYPAPLDPLIAGPFEGLRDAVDPAAAIPERARVLRNCYIPTGVGGGPVVGRPGFVVRGGQGGTMTSRTGQWVGEFTKLDGTTRTIRIIGARLETYDWGTATWSNVVTAADFAATSITVHTTNRIFTAILADNLIVSDGANTPWMWDGTNGSGGLTKLTNAPAFYGPIWVYYAKLFGIKLTDRATTVWSEENDPTTGYEAGGFNNAWTPSTTGSAPFYGGAGTNTASYVFRARSTTVVTGQVDTNFATQGTRAGIDTTGTTSPALVIGDRVYLVDADGRPHVLVPGGGAVPAWQECAETLKTVNKGALTAAALVHYTPADLLLIGLPGTGSSRISLALAFNLGGNALNCCGVWDGLAVDAWGMVLDGSGLSTLMHLGPDGFAYEWGRPDGSVWSDGLASGAVAISHQVTTGAMGTDTREEKLFDLIDLVFPGLDMTGVTSSYRTPRFASTPRTFSVVTPGPKYDTGLQYDSGLQYGAEAAEIKRTIGQSDAVGRWVEQTVTHATAGEEFGVVAVGARPFAAGDDVEVY